jgi:hypothetical protein
MAPRQGVDDADLRLVCARGGRPILLAAGDEGAYLADRTAFLSAHSRCVQRSAPAAT